MSDSAIEVLIGRVRQGDTQALDALLREHRPYLGTLAQQYLDSDVAVRVDPSDLVQQTCLDAFRDFASFRGTVQPELKAWLRSILEHNVADAVQTHVVSQKRALRRERHLDDSKGSGIPAAQLAADGSTPSGRMMRDEDAERLAKRIDTLPNNQCDAIRLRYMDGWSLAELAEHFGKTETAVAGLLKRGLQTLRKRYGDPE